MLKVEEVKRGIAFKSLDVGIMFIIEGGSNFRDILFTKISPVHLVGGSQYNTIGVIANSENKNHIAYVSYTSPETMVVPVKLLDIDIKVVKE